MIINNMKEFVLNIGTIKNINTNQEKKQLTPQKVMEMLSVKYLVRGNKKYKNKKKTK